MRVQPFQPLGVRVKPRKAKINKKQKLEAVFAKIVKPIKPND
jgi:hypothetical protein